MAIPGPDGERVIPDDEENSNTSGDPAGDGAVPGPNPDTSSDPAGDDSEVSTSGDSEAGDGGGPSSEQMADLIDDGSDNQSVGSAGEGTDGGSSTSNDSGGSGGGDNDLGDGGQPSAEQRADLHDDSTDNQSASGTSEQTTTTQPTNQFENENVQKQAEKLKDEVLSKPGNQLLGPEDVTVRREGDKLVAEFTREGAETRAANLAVGATEEDIMVSEQGGTYSFSLEPARRRGRTEARQQNTGDRSRNPQYGNSSRYTEGLLQSNADRVVSESEKTINATSNDINSLFEWAESGADPGTAVDFAGDLLQSNADRVVSESKQTINATRNDVDQAVAWLTASSARGPGGRLTGSTSRPIPSDPTTLNQSPMERIRSQPGGSLATGLVAAGAPVAVAEPSPVGEGALLAGAALAGTGAATYSALSSGFIQTRDFQEENQGEVEPQGQVVSNNELEPQGQVVSNEEMPANERSQVDELEPNGGIVSDEVSVNAGEQTTDPTILQTAAISEGGTAGGSVEPGNLNDQYPTGPSLPSNVEEGANERRSEAEESNVYVGEENSGFRERNLAEEDAASESETLREQAQDQLLTNGEVGSSPWALPGVGTFGLGRGQSRTFSRPESTTFGDQLAQEIGDFVGMMESQGFPESQSVDQAQPEENITETQNPNRPATPTSYVFETWTGDRNRPRSTDDGRGRGDETTFWDGPDGGETDSQFGTGWINEFVVAFGTGAGIREAPSQETLAGVDGWGDLTEQRPVAAQVTGGEQTQEQIDAAFDLLTFGEADTADFGGGDGLL